MYTFLLFYLISYIQRGISEGVETPLCDLFIRPHGYTCEEYQTITKDGYILNLQMVATTNRAQPSNPSNISSSSNTSSIIDSLLNQNLGSEFSSLNLTQRSEAGNTSSRPRSSNSSSVSRTSVLLDPALFVSGDMWFLSDVKSNWLPLVLADRGFDVWILNHRATKYSPDHIIFNRTDFQFWDFSFDEMAIYDMPAMIDLVHQVSGSSRKVHIVGFNQGAVIPVSALSLLPKLADSIESITLIAPIAYLVNVTSPIINEWGTGLTPDNFIYQNRLVGGQYNLTYTNLLQSTFSLFGINMATYYVSDGDSNSLVNNITGPNCCITQQTETAFANMDPNWVVSPYRNLVQYQQEIRVGRFQRWDYMSVPSNLDHYGQSIPPRYYPNHIPKAVRIFVVSGQADWFADPPNIVRLVLALDRQVEQLVVPRYAHFDMIFSSRVVNDVFNPVVDFINRVR